MSTPKTMEPPEPPVWYNQNEAAAWLAGWSDCAGLTETPVEGEVAELVALIHQISLAWEPDACLLGNMTAGQLTRAADLLERQATACAICERERLHQSTRAADLEVERQAAPVSERLPELRGMFERILCVARSSDQKPVGNIELADRLIKAVVSWDAQRGGGE